jgi:glycosyltransferase involved in cell wall biosynthesis
MERKGPGTVVLFDLKTDGHHIYYASYLARFLGETGYRVIFVTVRDKGESRFLPGCDVRYTGGNYDDTASGNFVVKYFRVARSHVQAALSLWRCLHLAADEQADVVQLLYLNGIELALYLWQMWRRRRLWRLFGIVVKPVYSGGLGEKAGALARFYNRLTSNAVRRMLEKGTLDAIFVHTDGIREAFIRRLGWQGRYSERIIVTPDPVNLPDTGWTREEARKRLGLPPGVPVLLFFGILLKNKGVDVLLEAMRGIEKDFRLVIAGRPEYFTIADIETLRLKLNDPSRVITRLEHIPDEEMPVYFLAADAVVLPYRGYSQGTSGVLQLAAAAGRPVVATDAGEIGETVRRHSLGIVVAPDSPEALRAGIEDFLSRPEAIAERVAPHALEYAGRSGWKEFAATIEAAYRAGRLE